MVDCQLLAVPIGHQWLDLDHREKSPPITSDFPSCWLSAQPGSTYSVAISLDNQPAWRANRHWSPGSTASDQPRQPAALCWWSWLADHSCLEATTTTRGHCRSMSTLVYKGFYQHNDRCYRSMSTVQKTSWWSTLVYNGFYQTCSHLVLDDNKQQEH